jgi:hypothetical protein
MALRPTNRGTSPVVVALRPRADPDLPSPLGIRATKRDRSPRPNRAVTTRRTDSSSGDRSVQLGQGTRRNESGRGGQPTIRGKSATVFPRRSVGATKRGISPVAAATERDRSVIAPARSRRPGSVPRRVGEARAESSCPDVHHRAAVQSAGQNLPAGVDRVSQSYLGGQRVQQIEIEVARETVPRG